MNAPRLSSRRRGLLGALGWALLAEALRAAVTLAPIFSDGAVLQRDKPVPIWGAAGAGESVRVRFGALTAEATADAAGRWRVTLPPLPAAATPTELVVRGADGATVRVRDVVVGEVWLCSGQSNMAFRVSRATGAKEDIPKANQPLIRQYDMPSPIEGGVQTPTLGRWSHTTPEHVRYFTAIGYYFALELQRTLGVPLGFIRAAAGGTPIEAWVSTDALRESRFAVVEERWRESVRADAERRAAHAKALAAWEADAAAAKAEGKAFDRKRPGDPPRIEHNKPGGMFDGMIAPLVPYALRGCLWYQGESNHTRPGEYGALFRALIAQWRRDLGQGELPFYFVQLPNYEQPTDKSGVLWARLREAQADALALPATAMAVTIDVGDPKDLHPPNKPEIARRLAGLARAHVYGEKVAAESPRAISFEVRGAEVRVRLSHAAGLTLPDDRRGGGEIAASDRVFRPATLRVEGDTVVFSAPGVVAPVAVRYAWTNAPETCLFNGAGLPVAPFRSDDW